MKLCWLFLLLDFQTNHVHEVAAAHIIDYISAFNTTFHYPRFVLEDHCLLIVPFRLPSGAICAAAMQYATDKQVASEMIS